MKKTKGVHVRLTPEQRELLEKVATLEGVTLSKLIRSLMLAQINQ